jgi:agmatine deiminase
LQEAALTKYDERKYRMPAEWERQSAIWLSWPHNIETWPENLAAAQNEFVKLVNTIATTQPVFVMAASDVLAEADRHLGPTGNVTLVDISTNDAWARDYAPTFVIDSNNQLVAIDWHYNAWGGKYPPFDDDQKVAKRVADYLDIESVSTDFCFEGGAIEVNDDAVFLCTRSCALDPNRNPKVPLEQVEKVIRDHLGVRTIIWLSGEAIEGDDTDGHIDQLARFINRETIVYAWSDDPSDPQTVGLAQNLNELTSQLVATGLGHYRLIPLPIPAPVEYCKRRIPASYCNFLITNELVLVPRFGVPEDAKVIEILTPLFPHRRVIGLDSRNLSVGLGSFHCLSQQQPAT